MVGSVRLRPNKNLEYHYTQLSMCINSELQLLIAINAGRMTHHFNKQDLFGKYNYGDVRVLNQFRGKFKIEGHLVNPDTLDVYDHLHFEADEKRLYVIADSYDGYCGEELIAECPTPTVLLHLMSLQLQKHRPWVEH